MPNYLTAVSDYVDNTELHCLAHTDDVLVLQFKHPDRILNSETITMIRDVNADGQLNTLGTIQFYGDAGEASFRPTWDPTQPIDYSHYSDSYLVEKLTAVQGQEYVYELDKLDHDVHIRSREYREQFEAELNDLDSDQTDEHEELQNQMVNTLDFIDKVYDLIVQMNTADQNTVAYAVNQLYDDEYYNECDLDFEDLEELTAMDLQLSRRVQVMLGLLRRLSQLKQDPFSLKTGEMIKIDVTALK